MNTFLITPEHSKSIARKLFAAAFPESGDWFDLAWDVALREPSKVTEFGPARDGLQIGDAADMAVRQMAREFAVLFDAFLQKYPIAQEALIECLETSCAKHDKNNSYKQRLKEKLKGAFGQQTPPLIISEASGYPQDSIFVNQLKDGKCFPVASCLVSGIKPMLKQYEYDLIIDEPNDELRVGKGSRLGLYSIVITPGMERGTLWLALTHVGGFVSHGDMKALFSFPGKSTSPDYYQYRHYLGKLVGKDLRNKLMEKGVNQLYKIPTKGWSFLWLRKHKEWDSSLLRHGLPKSLNK